MTAPPVPAADLFGRVRGLLNQRPGLADALLAVALMAIQAGLWLIAPPAFQPNVGTVFWTFAGTVPVAIRRRNLLLAVAATSAVFVLSTVLSTEQDSQGVPLAVLGYTVAAWLPLRRAILATALLWACALTALFRIPPEERTLLSGSSGVLYLLVENLVVATLVFFIGRAANHRRTSTLALEDRARSAEANQRALAEQAVADERRRIARELHDVVAHHVSVMSVLASGARRTLDRDRDQADEALATIEETGRSALRDLRRLVAVLRTAEDTSGDLTPQPDLGALSCLVDQVREAGLPVQLTVTGVDRLPSGIALTTYRIVQEALTNSLKHAGPARAEVRLEVRAGLLSIEVYDTGRGPSLGRGPMVIGHGLLGMRERVSLYGGTLRTGPRPGGGFRVYARIPLDGAVERAAAEPTPADLRLPA